MQALVYNGTAIHQRDEMVSLTDMWAAAGSEELKRPHRWYRTDTAKSFISLIAANLKQPEMAVWRAQRGRHGTGTWAHWQVAMAYAQFLNPQFHMWCNTVVRAHMEERSLEDEPRQEEMLLPPPFNSDSVTKTDLRQMCQWISRRLQQQDDDHREDLIRAIKGAITETWHAAGHLKKNLLDPDQLASRGLLLSAAPTPETTFITATEACWIVIPDDQLHASIPGIIGKRLQSHARRHCWQQGETPTRSRGYRPLPTYPAARVDEWLNSGGALLIKSENDRLRQLDAIEGGAIPMGNSSTVTRPSKEGSRDQSNWTVSRRRAADQRVPG